MSVSLTGGRFSAMSYSHVFPVLIFKPQSQKQLPVTTATRMLPLPHGDLSTSDPQSSRGVKKITLNCVSSTKTGLDTVCTVGTTVKRADKNRFNKVSGILFIRPPLLK